MFDGSCGVCQRVVFHEQCVECGTDVCEECEHKLTTCEICELSGLCPDCISPFNHVCEVNTMEGD